MRNNPPIIGKIAMNGSIRTATMKRHKCMADGGVIEQASRKVRQAVGGIADFLHVGKPAETTVLPPGQRRIPDNRPVVQDGMRSDMPQERYPRRFAEEVDQRKQARSGGYADGGIMPVRGKGTGTSDSIPAVLAGNEVRVSNGEGVAVLPAKTMRTPGALDAVEGIIAATNKRPPQPRTGGAGAYQTGVAGLVDDTAGRIVQAPAVTAPADGILAGIRDFASPTLPNMGPNLASAAAPPGTGQSQGFIGGADYSGGPDKNVGFVWSDGTPRVQPGQQGAVAPAAQAPGLLTMKERDIAAGLDPNRAYRPGTAGNPYAAAGGIAAAAQGRSAVPVADTAGVLPQMLDAVPGRRRGRRVPGYAGGGIMDALPVRYVPDAIDLARGQLETERARAADAVSRAEYARSLARDDALAKAQASGRTLPVPLPRDTISPSSLPAPVNPNTQWTYGKSASQVLDGVVETRADQARQAFAGAPRQVGAPQPGTAVVPAPSVPNWTYGDPNFDPRSTAVATTPYRPNWTFSGQQAGIGDAGPQAPYVRQPLALPRPPETYTPDLSARGMNATAAASKKAKTMSPEAAAYTASRPAAPEAKAAAAAPKESFMSGANDALKSGMRGELPPGVGRKYTPVMDTVAGKTGSAIGNGVQKAARVLAPVAIGADALSRAATVAGVAQDPNASGYDVATAGAEQGSQMAGGLAGAGIGAKTALVLGAPLIAGSGPFAPVTAAGLGILGGGLGYYGGEKLVQGLTSAGRKAVESVQQSAEPEAAPGRQSFQMLRQPDEQIAAPQAAPTSAAQDTNQPRIVSANMGRGFDPTKLQMADGYGAATNAAGKTLFVAPSQYQAADGSVTSDWRQTQQYKDAIERNAADKLRLAEMQALRQGRDPVATMAASRGIADAALNAPIERQAKQAAVDSAQIKLSQDKRIAALADTFYTATDPTAKAKALEDFNALSGRKKNEWKAAPIVMETLDGQKVHKVALYDETGNVKVIGPDGLQQQQSQTADAIKAQMLAGKITRQQAVAELRKLGFE